MGLAADLILLAAGTTGGALAAGRLLYRRFCLVSLAPPASPAAALPVSAPRAIGAPRTVVTSVTVLEAAGDAA